MAWAFCLVCGKEVRWSARRGSKIEDFRCECGGRLRGKRVQRDPSIKKLPRVRCGICNRLVETNAWVLLEPLVIDKIAGAACRMNEAALKACEKSRYLRLPAETVLCWRCEPTAVHVHGARVKHRLRYEAERASAPCAEGGAL